MPVKTSGAMLVSGNAVTVIKQMIYDLLGTQLTFDENGAGSYISLSEFGFADVWFTIHTHVPTSATAPGFEIVLSSVQQEPVLTSTSTWNTSDSHTVSKYGAAGNWSSGKLTGRLYTSKDKNTLGFGIFTENSIILSFFIARDDHGDAFYSVSSTPVGGSNTSVLYSAEASSASDSIAYSGSTATNLNGGMPSDMLYLTKMPNMCSPSGALALTAMIPVYTPNTSKTSMEPFPSYYLNGVRYIKVSREGASGAEYLLTPFLPY